MYSHKEAATTETLLRAVADPERRAILRHLRAADDRAVGVDELAEALESSGRTTGTEGAQRSIALHHSHLPMLVDANAIEHDRDDGSVTYCGDDRTDALLTFVTERLE